MILENLYPLRLNLKNMIHGTIRDFYTASKGTVSSVIKMLVNLDLPEEQNSCTVCAELPNAAIEFDMIKAGAAISWDQKNVFITIEEVEGIAFKKVGDTSSDEKTFYAHLESIGEVTRNQGK